MTEIGLVTEKYTHQKNSAVKNHLFANIIFLFLAILLLLFKFVFCIVLKMLPNFFC